MKAKRKRKAGSPPASWGPSPFVGYAEYRYGALTPKKSRPIYNPAKREHVVAKVQEILKDWEYSAFEHEAACRHGLRQGFCMEGHGWQQSDDEAAFIVGEALRGLGAKRPTWLEGQWAYTTPPENCAHCGREIDDPDATRKQRFCSVACARAALASRARKQGKENDTIVHAAYRLIQRRTSEPIECRQCGKLFQATKSNALYCSGRCRGRAVGDMLRTLPDRQCACCGATFRPRRDSGRCCSTSCASKLKLREAAATLPDRICEGCGCGFHPATQGQTFCEERCRNRLKSLRARIKIGQARVTPFAFDYLVRTVLPPHLTPARFDAMLMAA